MSRIHLSLLTLVGCAVSAQASVFSFASDMSDNSWTFLGEHHSDHYAITDGIDISDPMTLLIDDNNGVLDPLSFQVDFNTHMDLDYLTSTDLGGGLFLHSYAISEVDLGWFTNAGPIMEVSVTGGILTAVGGQASWGSTATIQASDSFGSVTYTSFINEPDYGMFEGTSVGNDDFAFTLTALNTSGSIPYDFTNPGVDLGTDMLPVENFYSEGSFSGAAQFVPAPATALLFAGAGLFGMRKRRC